MKGLQISVWTSYINAELINFTSLLMCYFFLGLSFLLISKNVEDYDISILKNKVKFNIGFYISISIALYFSIVGLNGDTIITSAYGSGDVHKTAAFEYSIIFFLIAMLMSCNTTIHKIIIYIFAIYFSLKSFIYGGRIEVVQIAIVFAYISKNLLIKENILKIIIVVLFSYSIINFVGAIRSDPSIVKRVIALDFPLTVKNTSYNTNVLITNESDVTQATTRIIGMQQDGEISTNYRIKSFISYIFNLPLIVNQEYSNYQNLAIYKKNIYGSGGGGLIVGYFYVWLGIIGPIAVGMFIGLVTKWLYQTENIYKNVYALLVIISFPRWFAYGPVTLVKFCLVGLLYLFVMKNIQYYLKLK
ncbi:hypothetical protein [Photobacterium leiognathi]|uniref:hypothetical protein n=1 Tax=Photobacterium leiognathi TaxID=553611 RepID=UPI002980FDDF|nr:hypothetical protein [Photobacterium leiognathi]